MRKLSVGIAGALLFAAAACNLHLDESLLAADQAVDSNLTGEAGAPDGDAGTKPVIPPTTQRDAGTDADVKKDGGDGGPPVLGENKLCPAGGVLEREPNDAVLSANTFPVGALCGHVDVAADQDWFTWEIGDDGIVKMNFDAEGDGFVTLFNADSSVTFSGGNGSRYTFATKPNTRFTARVFSPGSKTQSYVMSR